VVVMVADRDGEHLLRFVLLDDKAIGPQLGTNSIVAFAEDNQGELYIVTAGGSVQRLVAA
jgi:hypothetical protein